LYYANVTLHQSIDVQRGKGVQYECPEIEAINDTRPDRLEIKKEIPQNRNVSLWKWKPFSAAHDSTLATRHFCFEEFPFLFLAGQGAYH
jgi:hypothetical protein